MSAKKYWAITEDDAYVRVFDEMLEELDHALLDPVLTGSYMSLSLEARYIVTRLYFRTHKWVRYNEFINYLPPESLAVVLPELVSHGWLLDKPSFEDILAVSSLEELQGTADYFKIKRTGLNRKDLVCALTTMANRRTFFATSVTLKSKLTAKLLQHTSSCYKLGDTNYVYLQKLEFMFLVPANITSDVIVRANMGLVKFLKYNYIPQKRDQSLFSSSNQFEDYFTARLICDPIETMSTLTSDSVCDQVKQGYLSSSSSEYGGSYSSKYVWGRAIYLVSRLLGKAHRFQEEYNWIQMYLGQSSHISKRGVLLIRKLLLELRFHVETNTKVETVFLNRALNTYLDAIAEVNEIDAIDLGRKASKLGQKIKASGGNISPISTPFTVQTPEEVKVDVVEGILRTNTVGKSTKTQWGARDALVKSVEETALDHYIGDGWSGGHYENSMLSTIFWLATYDILFDDPHSLRCRFQSAPIALQKVLDSKKEEILERFNDSDATVATVEHHYNLLVQDTPLLRGVNWDIEEQSILNVIRCFGSALKPVISRLTTDYAMYSSGFPDLMLWNVSSGSLKIVEVKSENDKISDSQRLWMEFLMTQGIEVVICRVLNQGSKSAQKRKSQV